MIMLCLPLAAAALTSPRAVGPRMMDSLMRERMPNAFLSFQPTFIVTDWAAIPRLMEAYVDHARSENGCSCCGWSRCEDRLFVSEAHRDADALVDHLNGVAPIVAQLLAGAAALERAELHGPASSFDACRNIVDELTDGRAQYFASLPGAFSFFSKQTGGMMTGQSFCSLRPMLTVSDMAAAQPLLDSYLERVAAQPGCIYTGFTRCEKSGNALFSREAHSNADAMISHLEIVRPILQALCDGPAALEGLELHGPSMQLARVRAAVEAGELLVEGVPIRYLTLGGGFQRFEAWSSYVAQPKPRFG